MSPKLYEILFIVVDVKYNITDKKQQYARFFCDFRHKWAIETHRVIVAPTTKQNDNKLIWETVTEISNAMMKIGKYILLFRYTQAKQQGKTDGSNNDKTSILKLPYSNKGV